MVAARDYLQDFSIPPLCGRPVRDGTTCSHDDDDDDGDDFPNSEKWMAHKCFCCCLLQQGVGRHSLITALMVLMVVMMVLMMTLHS